MRTQTNCIITLENLNLNKVQTLQKQNPLVIFFNNALFQGSCLFIKHIRSLCSRSCVWKQKLHLLINSGFGD